MSLTVHALFPAESFKLCYVEGAFAHFTTRALADQWGDDWDDAPYEHNAGEPYVPTVRIHDKDQVDKDYDERGNPLWAVIKVAFQAPGLGTPADLAGGNSHFSVEGINAGGAAWLFGCPNWLGSEKPMAIQAGTSLPDFIEKVSSIKGGQVYCPLQWAQK